MSVASHRLERALNLRPGESRTLGVLGAYLLVCTASVTVLIATMNGLFLSVYPGRLIPHVIIASALLTAAAAVLFSGVIAGAARRNLAAGLSIAVVLTLLACRWAVGVNPRMSFAVYLAVSTINVLLLTHAWDFVSDVLQGRQAKRLVPLIGVFASVGAIVGGLLVPYMAVGMGTDNLLLVGGALILAALPLLWLVPEPTAQEDDTASEQTSPVKAFTARAGRGLRGLKQEPLLRLLAIGMLAIGLTGTLIELEFKLALQASYKGDEITAILGVLGSVTGAGTLLMQVLASRLIFPKLGVSWATKLHAGLETFAVGLAAVFPGVWFLGAGLATDDILQKSVQKGWEQVSLVPFPGPVKSAAIATLDGVIQPLAAALGGVITILLASRLPVVSAIMTGSAALALFFFLRHRKLYVSALTQALLRHTVDLRSLRETSLVVDQQALGVIDRSLADDDATVVVFAVSLLEQLSTNDAVPRLVRLLSHAIDEVRVEACHVIGRMDVEDEPGIRDAVMDGLRAEEAPFVLASLLEAMGGWHEMDAAVVEPFLDHADPQVRRAALVALGRTGWPVTSERIQSLLASPRGEDRALGAAAIGDLGLTDMVDQVAAAVDDAAARPAALEALARLGPPAVPVLAKLLERRAVPLPVRRSVVTALASMSGPEARDALLGLVEEPALGPAALTSLQRMRRDGRLEPVDPEILRGRLEAEIRRGLRYAAVASATHDDEDPRIAFITHEMVGLCNRALTRVGRMLSLSHDPTAVEAARAGLESGDIGRRGNALELLESMLSPEEAVVAMPFAEAMAEGFPMESLKRQLGEMERIARAPLEALTEDDDWWPKALGLHGLGRDDEISIPGRDPDLHEEPSMIPLIERVMILKGSELFRYFPGNDLAGIASLVEVVYLETGDVVFEQGDPGDAFYMVVRGAIRISRGSHELALLGPREGFGEMAILDKETRSATATAAEPTTLMEIDRDSFDRLIEQNPSVARGIYRVLNQRLRNTLAQVAAG